jgi:hypothetical protein
MKIFTALGNLKSPCFPAVLKSEQKIWFFWKASFFQDKNGIKGYIYCIAITFFSYLIFKKEKVVKKEYRVCIERRYGFSFSCLG